MPQTVMILNHPTLKVATTEAGLTAGTAVECQVNSAVVTATPNYVTIASTGCTAAVQSPGLTSFALDMTFLQDWTAGQAASLSWFAFNNDGTEGWIELTPDTSEAGDKITGPVNVHAANYGGTFGDGSAATATVSWPFKAKPVPVTAGVMMAGAEASEDAEAA